MKSIATLTEVLKAVFVGLLTSKMKSPSPVSVVSKCPASVFASASLPLVKSVILASWADESMDKT